MYSIRQVQSDQIAAEARQNPTTHFIFMCHIAESVFIIEHETWTHENMLHQILINQ